jgi:hypothetical protein
MARLSRSSRYVWMTGLGLMILSVPSGEARAQDAGGKQSRFFIDVTAQAERNPDLDPGVEDEEFQLETTLGYGLSLSTQSRTLDFSLQGAYAATQSDTTTDGSGFESPVIAFDYGYDGLRRGVTASLSYRESDVSDLSLDLDESGTVTLYEGEGTRAYGTLALGFDGGRDTPLRYSVDFSANAVRYSGIPSSSLSSYYGSDTQQVAFGLAADLSPLATLTLDSSYKTYQAEDSDETERDTLRATLGADLRLDDITALSMSVGRSRIETRDLSDDEVESGLVGEVALTREDKLGEYSLSYERSLSENGGRDTVRVARRRAFQAGDLSASFGLTRGSSDDITWVSAVDFSVERSRSEFDFSLHRTISTDDDGYDVTVTRAQAGWSHMISPVGSLGLDLSARLTEEEADADTERYDVTLSWNRQLRKDVALSAGATARLAREEGEEDARAGKLFLTLSRSFSGRP